MRRMSSREWQKGASRRGIEGEEGFGKIEEILVGVGKGG